MLRNAEVQSGYFTTRAGRGQFSRPTSLKVLRGLSSYSQSAVTQYLLSIKLELKSS